VTEKPAVTVYTKPSCLSCKRVIAQLEKVADVEVIDLSDPAFPDAASYVTNVLGAKSVPVIVSDLHGPILGYQPEKLRALIAALTSNGEQ
jgi:glutaredoxin-like protein NrdH